LGGFALEITVLMVIGIIGVIFRLWLAEFKLKDELGFRRHYLSRFVNIYLFCAMLFNLESYIFNLIIITCFPVMLVTSFWDLKFYQKFKTRNYWEKNKNWLLVERLTMHPPMVGFGLFFYIAGILPYFNYSKGVLPAIIAILVVYVPFFLWDKRWTEKYNWPQGLIMISLMVFSTTVTLTVVYLVTL
jgi:hypothetical protein